MWNTLIGKEISGARLRELFPKVKFIKYIHEDLIHNGFTYQLGLNIDTVPFKPIGSCSSGGLYFTIEEYSGEYKSYGPFLAVIDFPPNARIYFEENKAKADRLIITSLIHKDSIKINEISDVILRNIMHKIYVSKVFHDLESYVVTNPPSMEDWIILHFFKPELYEDLSDDHKTKELTDLYLNSDWSNVYFVPKKFTDPQQSKLEELMIENFTYGFQAANDFDWNYRLMSNKFISKFDSCQIATFSFRNAVIDASELLKNNPHRIKDVHPRLRPFLPKEIKDLVRAKDRDYSILFENESDPLRYKRLREKYKWEYSSVLREHKGRRLIKVFY